MDRATKRILRAGIIISQRCALIDTHLVLSAIEAVPAASLALHVLLRLADLAGQRAHALGWLRMSQLELNLCKQTTRSTRDVWTPNSSPLKSVLPNARV